VAAALLFGCELSGKVGTLSVRVMEKVVPSSVDDDIVVEDDTDVEEDDDVVVEDDVED